MATTVVQATAVSLERSKTGVDVDPGSGLVMRQVDTEAAPDHLLAFAGRTLSWTHGFEPPDDSGRA